jgi:hypothetical protein
MLIYVSHSTSFNFRDELYKPLRESELAGSHQFIFPHDSSDNQFPTKKLFLDKVCDLVLAEVSFPSTGQGIELGWADNAGIRIVCVYKETVKFSVSLKAVSKELVAYKNTDELIQKLSQILNQ